MNTARAAICSGASSPDAALRRSGAAPALNSGKYYSQEITPPKGYLIDDTIYDVKFEYDDDKTMYIPVYAKHSNEQTEVSLTKEDITGEAEIPGNEISFYKIKDVNDVDEWEKVFDRLKNNQ